MNRLFVAVLLTVGLIGASSACVMFSKNENTNAPSQVIVPAPTPSASPTASPTPGAGQTGDNVPKSLGIFCYGFGAMPGQTEPNHDACRLPDGYSEIAVTASPKSAAGLDIPFPTQNLIWSAEIIPAGSAVFTVDSSNPFNARIAPALGPRVASSVLLTATYIHTDGTRFVASKNASLAAAGASGLGDFIESSWAAVRGRIGR